MKFPPRHRAYPTLVLIAMLVLALRVASTWFTFNDTIDEPYHLGAGVAMFEAKRHVYGIQHPPLPRLVAALPVVIAGVQSEDPAVGEVVADLRAFEVGHHVLMRSELAYWTALVLARSAMLVFPLLAVWYVYLLGKYLGNPLIGCVAAVFFSTDATLLGHASWIATDVAAAAGYLVGTYHGLRFVARPTLARATVAGVAVGFALACKFSCALVIVALAVVWILRGRRAIRTARRAIPLGALAFVLALVVLWATYFFDFGAIEDLRVHNPERVPPPPEWLASIPLPMPTAVVGYRLLAHHNAMGHFAYLNGEVREGGWWYYFPEAIAIKSPLALLLAVALAIAFMLLARRKRLLRVAAILVPMLVFLLVSMSAQINIGVRHVLPAIPFLYLFASFWLARARRTIVATALVILAFIETAAVHPDYVAFFNLLAGGPRHGEKYLLDSNLDWGQDLWRLKRWLDTNAQGRVVSLRVFGNPRLRQWPHDGRYTVAPEASEPTGLFAVSKNYLYDLYPSVVTTADGRVVRQPSVAWLQQHKPVARIGYSIEVYDMDAMREK